MTHDLSTQDAREPFEPWQDDDQFLGRDPDPQEYGSWPDDVPTEDASEGSGSLGDGEGDELPTPDPACAWCGSVRLNYLRYDYGQDPETGYYDAGDLVMCLNCGRSDEVSA